MSGYSTLEQAGDFRVEECVLQSSSGTVHDEFQKQIQGIQITESLFTNSLSGALLVTDNNNLPMNMPITGQDFFTLKLITPNLESEPIIDTVFSVAQIKSKQEISVGAQAYVLSLQTPELLLDNRVRIKSSFTDVSSNIVEKILRENLKTTKNILLEETTGTRKHVAPYQRPFTFIKHLMRESISKSKNSPHYYFFENTRGYNFVTTDYLYEQDAVGKFEVSDTGVLENLSKRDLERDLSNILSYTISDSSDTLYATRGGMLSSRNVVYNIFNKNYEVYTYDYFKEFNKYGRINNNPIYNESEIDEKENTLSMFPEANINLHPTSKSNNLDARYSGNYVDNQSEKWLLPFRGKSMEMSFGQSVELTIHGRANLAVGDKIHLTLPIIGKTHGNENIEKFYDGEFLVTHIKHEFRFVPESHVMTLSVMQDGVPKPYEVVGETKEPKKQGTTTKV